MKSSKVLLLAVFVLFLTCFNPSTAVVPVAQFTGTPTYGSAPLNVTFTVQSTGSLTGWAWYFGDENFIAPWILMNASAGWSARAYYSSVAMPDGSIVLMGGTGGGPYKNDTWRSNDNGATWTLMNASSGWEARYMHTSVAMPDGSIVLIGGQIPGDRKNDVWRSTDNGTTWILMTASAGWTTRYGHSSVAMPDGSIVLTGGLDGNFRNDTWRSVNNGTTWTLMNASSGWTTRYGHSSVAMQDGSIVLMGGTTFTAYNDVWRSTDNGATWMLMTANAGWLPRGAHSSVAMPDGSIVLMGGQGVGSYNDTWRSTDYGATWTPINMSSEWFARSAHTSVAMPDGSIVLMGGTGGGYRNDTWRFVPTGSSVQNPSHTYTSPGIYQVALQVYNAGGYNSTRKAGYINVSTPLPLIAGFIGTPLIGIAPLMVTFTDQSTGTPDTWNWTFGDGNVTNATDKNPTHSYLALGTYDVSLNVTNANGFSNITNKKGYITVTRFPTTKVGIFQPGGNWFLDMNNNGSWDGMPPDRTFSWGKLSGDIPITGDWTGDNITETGIFRSGGSWYLDMNNNGTWDSAPTDRTFSWGKQPGDIPITGDWNGDNITETGIFRPGGSWFFDMNNNGTWDSTPTDRTFSWGKLSGDIPITGDWNGDKITETGIFRRGIGFYLDMNNNGVWDGGDTMLAWGLQPSDIPVTGDWNGDGITETGIFRNGDWYLDINNNGHWDPGTDVIYLIGQPSDKPVTGKW